MPVGEYAQLKIMCKDNKFCMWICLSRARYSVLWHKWMGGGAHNVLMSMKQGKHLWE